MKKIFLLLMFCCMSFIINAQDQKKVYYKGGQLKEIKTVSSLGILHGLYEAYYESGQLSQIGEYYIGMKIGTWTSYYENGQLGQKGEIDLDKKIGEWRTYYKHGLIRTIENYNKGNQTGEWKYYLENGQLFKTENYPNQNSKGNLTYGNMRAPDYDYIQFGSTYHNGSKNNPMIQVRLNFKKSDYTRTGTINAPNSPNAFYLIDNNGKKYRLKGIDGWNGEGIGGYGSRKLDEELSVVLSFENIPLNNIKSLDLIEGNCTKGCWNFYNINFIK